MAGSPPFGVTDLGAHLFGGKQVKVEMIVLLDRFKTMAWVLKNRRSEAKRKVRQLCETRGR